jgi:hypothetical protein
MCNCNKISPCNNCCKGIPCNCPPTYPVATQPVPCNCCPNGYTFQGATPNFPSGYCLNDADRKTVTSVIPCVVCEDTLPTDCVVYNGQIPIACPSGVTNIYGIIPGDTLTDIITKMCISNENVLEAMLTAIGNSSRALAGFCHLVQRCGVSPGISTPIIGPITFSIP